MNIVPTVPAVSLGPNLMRPTEVGLNEENLHG